MNNCIYYQLGYVHIRRYILENKYDLNKTHIINSVADPGEPPFHTKEGIGQ